MAAHELRTPLTALKLQVQGLRREVPGKDVEVPPGAAARLDVTERHVQRLETLVRRVLEAADLASGRIALQAQRVDLAELVGEVARRLAPLALRSGCEVVLELAAGVTGPWDRGRLGQAIEYLVTNAIKFGSNQPVILRVEASGGRARLHVADRGIGIHPDDHDRIFRRFERAVPDNHYGGFGLGLWMTKKIATALGGAVFVTSTPGAGAVFTLALPMDSAPAGDSEGKSPERFSERVGEDVNDRNP